MKKIIMIAGFAVILFTSSYLIVQARLANNPFSPSTPVIEQLPMYINYGGRAVAVAVMPDSAIDAMVASESGGLFRTSNNGNTWTRVNTLPMTMMNDVQYANQYTVIASGKADGKLPNDTGGIWVSSDSGATWWKPNNYRPTCATRVNTGSIAIGGGKVYVANDCGYSLSTDFGTNWSHVNMNATPYAVAATSTGDLYTCDWQGVIRANGTTIVGHASIEHGCRDQPHNLAVSPVDNNVIYIVDTRSPTCTGDQDEGTLFEGVYNPGTNWITWTQASETKCRPKGAGRAPYVATTLSRDNNSSHYDVYFSDGYYTYRKTCSSSGSPRCGGTSNWQWMPTPHVDHNDIDFDPFNDCPKFLATDGGPTRPSSDEQNWCGNEWGMAGTPSNGYNALQIYDIVATNMSDHIDIYAGTQDNGFWGSRDGGLTWPDTCGNEGYFLTGPLTGTNHFAESIWTTYSDPGANGNFQLYSHLNCPANPWEEPLIFDRYRHGAPLLVGDKVYAQFAKLTSTPPYNFQLWLRDWPSPWAYVSNTTVNLAPIGQVSYAGNAVSIYQPFRRTVDLTRNQDFNMSLMRFTGMNKDGSLSLNAIVSAVDGNYPTSLEVVSYYPPGEGAWFWPVVFGVDPNNPNNLLAADLGSNSMKYTTNGGMSWAVDTNLTNLVTGNGAYAFTIRANERRDNKKVDGAASQAHAIAFNPFVRNHILVGTQNQGIIQSWDGGVHWATISGTSPITNITDFAFKKPASGENTVTFYVSTYGRGVWKVTVGTEFHVYMMTAVFLEGSWSDLAVDPLSEYADPVDTRLLTDPSYCPDCRFFTLPRNQIMNLVLTDGQLSDIGVDSGRLIGSNVVGEPLQSEISPTILTEYGDFYGCPACATVIANEGQIRGVVTSGDNLVAILISYGDLPGAEEIVRFEGFPPEENIGSEFWGIYTPYLVLEGSYPFGGAAVVGSEDYLTIHGSGFNSDDVNCTHVSLYLEDEDIAGTWPTEEGRFDMAIQMTEPAGMYWLRATQTCTKPTQPGESVAEDEIYEDGSWVKVVIEEGWWPNELIFLPLVLR